MTEVLHIIHSLTAGGAARTMIATAKYSAKLGPFHHRLAILDLQHTDPIAAQFAESEGMEVVFARNEDEIRSEIERADIVQVNWWQHPQMDLFLRSALPACRFIGWFHVSGERSPQAINSDLIELFDLVIGGSEHTWYAPTIQALSPELREAKTGYVIGGADFDRLRGMAPRTSSAIGDHTFRVGYIGTVNFVKMHPDYLSLHGTLNIPNLKVVVCGGDMHLQLAASAAEYGWQDRFDFRGYVNDIRPVLESLDVYGYPLCQDTYAASELNLQEAMYAGVPPVVFPHGGIGRLVMHEKTGLVVHTAQEYREAIEYLYHHPRVRRALGEAAHEYARTHFGAENNAPRMNRYYESLLQHPKRERVYPGYTAPGIPETPLVGHEVFLRSLGSDVPYFVRSLHPEHLDDALQADEEIVASSTLMKNAGILPYQSTFHGDAALQLWGGLALLGQRRYAEGAKLLLDALQSGEIREPDRLLWYLGLASAGCQDFETAADAFLAFADRTAKSPLASVLVKKIRPGQQIDQLSILGPTFKSPPRN